MKSKGSLGAAVSALIACFGCAGNSPIHLPGFGGNGGSGEMAGAQGDGRLFVPDDLPHLPRAGEVGVP